MPNLIDVLGAQSVQQNSVDPTAGLKEGLKTGIGLAQANQQLQLQKQAQQDNEIELQKKKANALANATKGLLFADETVAPIAQKNLERLANQIGATADVDAIMQIRKDPLRRKAMQDVMNDISSGKVTDYGAAVAGFADSATMLNVIDSKLPQNFLTDQKRQQDDRELQAKLQNAKEIARENNATKAATTDKRTSVSMDRLDYQKHKDVINGIQNDKSLNALKDSYNNISIAVKNFDVNPSTQEFHELQQVLRANAGVKGSSGVAEREATYLKSVGIKLADFAQAYGNETKDVNDYSPEMVKAIKHVAASELQSKQSQAKAQLDKLSKRNSSFYDREGFEDVRNERDATIADTASQFNIAPAIPGQAPAAAPAAAATKKVDTTKWSEKQKKDFVALARSKGASQAYIDKYLAGH